MFLIVLAVYVFSAYPTFAPRDSADLAAAALTLGVAHAPGYALYSLLGRLWIALVPFGDPAYRLNLLSAAASAAAAACMFFLFRRRLAELPSFLGALCFAAGASAWKFSLLSEMYSLQALFVAVLLLLAEGPADNEDRRAAASGLLFGLGLVNHLTMIFLAPALVWLWRGSPLRRWKRIFIFAAAGLALDLFVVVRLGDLPLALRVLRRADYGTLELFQGFSAPLTLGTARSLSWACLGGLAAGCPLAALWPVGLWLRRREKRAVALGLALAAFGPGYFLLTRFDLSSWVARTVLEPALIVPSLAACLLAAEALANASRLVAAVATGAALAGALALNAPRAAHRDDFLAYDYARDLRRLTPPGGAALVQGDTALFGLRYLNALAPGRARDVRGTLDAGNPGWLAERAARGPVLVAGLPMSELEPLVAARAGFPPPGAWPLSVLRRGASFRSRESYARDVILSRAFANFSEGQLAAKAGADPTTAYLRAAILDPDEYQIEWEPAKTYNGAHARR